ncbi:MAG: tetratricopeptide repeat protein [Bacteroidales bacterium]|nr:tetratricopeptide repeat protein [Bacteroidales bacterium]
MKRLVVMMTALLLCMAAAASTPRQKKEVENFVIDIASAWEAGDTAGVENMAAKMLEIDPDNDAVYYYRGLCASARGDLKAAEHNFFCAIERDTSNVEYIDALAGMYAGFGRTSHAASIYRAQEKRRPGCYRNPYILSLIADEELRAGNDSSAVSHYDAALSLDPDFALALLGKAEMYRMKANMPAFLTELLRFASNPVVEAGPKTSYLKEVFSRVDGRIYMSWHSQLDAVVEGCLSAHPADSGAWNFAAQWYYSTDRKPRGVELFEKVCGAYPSDPLAHLTMMQVYALDKSYDRALSEGDRVLALTADPGVCLDVHSLSGDILQEDGLWSKAAARYRKALKIRPDYVPVLNNYAYLLCQQGRSLGRALKMSAVVVEKEPDNATYLDTYGWILHLMGRSEEARGVFKHAVACGGRENAVVLTHYAEVLSALGDTALSEYYSGLAKSRPAEER